MHRILVLLSLLALSALAVWAAFARSNRAPSAVESPEHPEERASHDEWVVERGEVGISRAPSTEPAPVAEPERDVEATGEAEAREPATLEGFVYDDDGAPIEGARIQVDGDETRVVWSDAMGAYEVRAIAPGLRWVSVRAGGGAFGATDQMLELRFASGERKLHDFGSPLSLPRLRGVLRSRSGAVVSGGAVHASPTGGGDHRRARCDEAGRYELRLVPGAYRLSVSSAAHPKRYRVVSNLEMGTQDQELDLELRGSSLTGKVLGLPADFGDRTLKIGARLEGHDFPAAVHSVEMNADRTYRFDGLGPGTWILSTWPEARTPATVVLSEDVVESAFDLVFD